MSATDSGHQASEKSVDRAIQALDRAPGGLNRLQLMEQLGLSRPTVTAIVAEMTKSGWLSTTEVRSEGRGRATNELRLTGKAGWVGAIHVGNSTLRAGLATGDRPLRSQWPPEGESSAYPVREEGLKTLAEGVRRLRSSMDDSEITVDDLRGICIGIPAPISRADATIQVPLALSEWTQDSLRVPLREHVESILGRRKDGSDLPLFFENEAAADARGILDDPRVPVNLGREAGVDQGAQDFLYLKVSTGIAAGIVLGGRVLHGARDVAGDLAHLPAANPGSGYRSCLRCNRVCLDSVASVEAITERMLAIDLPTPEDPRPSDLIDLAVNKPEEYGAFRAILVDAAAVIGATIADLVGVLDLEVVVLGGVFAKADSLVVNPMQQALDDSLLSPVKARVVDLRLWERREVGLRGELAIAREKTRPFPFVRDRASAS